MKIDGFSVEGRYFTGNISNLSIYTTALTTAEIENLYNQSSVLYDHCINKHDIKKLICSPIMNSDNKLYYGCIGIC